MSLESSWKEVLAIQELLNESTETLDQQRYEEYLTLFAPESVYKIHATDRMTADGTMVLDVDRDGLKARLDLLKDPARVREEAAQTHLVSWGPIEIKSAAAEVKSRFALYETKGMDGVSKLAYVGRFHDRLIKNGTEWRIAERLVKLDTFAFRALIVPI